MTAGEQQKVIVLADPETLFLPNMIAKMASAGCVSAIILRKAPFNPGRVVEGVRKYLAAFGLGTVAVMACSTLLGAVCGRVFNGRYYSLQKVAYDFGMPLYVVEKVHSDQLFEILDKELSRPDHPSPPLVFSQVGVKLKKSLLDRGVFISRHCGLLPAYAGVNPVFWALLNGEKHLGVSVFEMTEEYDEGRILKQVKVSSGGCTFFSAYHRLFDITADLVIDFLRSRQEDWDIEARSQSYFSWPTRHDRVAFARAGYRFGMPFRFHPPVQP